MRPRRERRGAATATERAWLLAAPGHNQFIGFGFGTPGKPTLARMAALWKEHEAEIRALWREEPPPALPYAHPGRADGSFEHALERERRQAARRP